MRSLVALSLVALSLVALTLAAAAPFAGAHVTKNAGAYMLKVGWASEPAVAQERNQVTIQVWETSSGAGVANLASKLTVSVLHGTFSSGLPISESDEAPGNYSATIIPTEPGLYKIRVQGSIGATQVGSDFDIEDVKDPVDFAFPKQGTAGTGVSMTDLQNEFQKLRSDVDKIQVDEQKEANRIPGIGVAGALFAVGGAAAVVAIGRRTR